MHPSIGQVVVHPHHGPATVVDVLERTFRDTTHRYLQLEVVGSDMVVSVPVTALDDIGLRPLSDAAGVDEIVAVLAAPSDDMPEVWSRRFKENQERLRSRDHLVQAEVVRDLTRRQTERSLSMGEKQQLVEATEPLLTEIALALDVDRQHAQEVVDAAIEGQEAVRELPAAS